MGPGIFCGLGRWLWPENTWSVQLGHQWGWSPFARTYNWWWGSCFCLVFPCAHRRKTSFLPGCFSLSSLLWGEIIKVLGTNVLISTVSIRQGPARKAGVEYGVTRHVAALIYGVITVTNFCLLKHQGLKWLPWRRKKISGRILTNSRSGSAALPLHWIKSDQHGQRGPARDR